MARSWQTTGLLLLSGLGCLAVGVSVGGLYQWPAEKIWDDPTGPKVQVITQLPTFRDLVQRVESSVVSVRALMPVAITEGAVPSASPAVKSRAVSPAVPSSEVPEASRAAAAGPATQNGSGFIINERGLVLTSRHVVVGAESIEIILPNHRPRRADLIGQDAATDLALLRLVSAPKNLPALSIGDSDQVLAGDWIVAVGNPYGFTRTVTAGLVSFVGRHLPNSDLGVSSDFMQISAQVNPGSSGCPVFDVYGHVVGVTTQFATSAQGISFAVPSRSVKWALHKMREQPDGIVRRGYLGIHFGPRRAASVNGEAMPGAVIVGVAAGDPADLAGLRSGDVVLAVDGMRIRDPKDLHERIVCSDPGASIALQLLRGDQLCDPIIAVLGEVGQRRSTTENL